MRWWRGAAAATSAVALTACSQGALSPRGPGAERLSDLLWLMVVLAGVVLLIVGGSAVVAALRAPDDDLDDQRVGTDDPRGHERRIERWMVIGGGIALPVVVLGPLMAVNVATIAGTPESGPLQVDVVAHQYWWEIGYDGFETANELHLPVDTQVELRITSEDVIHSVWVPELSGKIDAVPGRDTSLVLEASEPGRYTGRCAEYCGLQHAWMLFEVVAHEPDDYERWRERESEEAAAPEGELERRGQEVFLDHACVGCHTIRGVSERSDVAPDLTHLASREELGAGVLDNDEDALRGWVVNPQASKPGVNMPPQQLSEDELDALVAYLEALE